ncbi:hypothetical protein OBBRIDRAFT_836900 [Obba rivulosa]|uniref:DUF6534 domain-containing protein n=1 Tax=Obba rivulosa TaxID=1052685 RepID=A0A8E2DMI3_9APHY|nr:hypothetical protein OBBRIDRAFT_836900 [Obba rivulosa]
MAATVPSSVIHSLIEPNVGALILSLTTTSIFFGITILQTYHYYDRYWSDPLYMKLYVLLLALLDTAQQVTVMYTTWFWAVRNYGDPSSLTDVPVTGTLEIGLTISVGVLVHGFFATRAYIMSGRNPILPSVIMVFSATHFAAGTYFCKIYTSSQDFLKAHHITWPSTVSLSCSMTADVVITTSLCYYLYKGRSGLQRTDKLITVLMIYTINTGLTTLITAMLTMILVQAPIVSATLWSTIPYYLISKCYVNSMLATLNAREKLRSMPAGTDSISGQLELGARNDRSTTVVLRRTNDVISEIAFSSGSEATTEKKALESMFVPEI